jgi:hypothetical protein
MESEIITDIATCYHVACENNDALTCGLIRVNIGSDGKCMEYSPIEEDYDLIDNNSECNYLPQLNYTEQLAPIMTDETLVAQSKEFFDSTILRCNRCKCENLLPNKNNITSARCRNCGHGLPLYEYYINNPYQEEQLLYTCPKTNLTWSRNGNIAGKKMNWHDAIAWIENLTYCGFIDWRLPTKSEFDAFLPILLRQGVHVQNASELLNTIGFTSVESYLYWTSSTCVSVETTDYQKSRGYHKLPASYYASAIYMATASGSDCDAEKKDHFFIWPVRG